MADGTSLTLQKNAVFTYTLDTDAKMINFAIGQMTGSAHYRFNADRTEIAICEDGGSGIISTAIGDAN